MLANKFSVSNRFRFRFDSTGPNLRGASNTVDEKKSSPTTHLRPEIKEEEEATAAIKASKKPKERDNRICWLFRL